MALRTTEKVYPHPGYFAKRVRKVLKTKDRSKQKSAKSEARARKLLKTQLIVDSLGSKRTESEARRAGGCDFTGHISMNIYN